MENDLISRSGLLSEYDSVHTGKPGRARKLIEDAPEAIVRCLKCRHWLKGNNAHTYGWCIQRSDLAHVSYKDRTEPMDFCSKGEKAKHNEQT